MKKTILLLCCTFMAFSVKAQSLVGAWEGQITSVNGEVLKSVIIFSEGYKAEAVYNSKTGAFLSTNGGYWKLSGQILTEKIEFDSAHPDNVGKESSFEVAILDTTFTIADRNLVYNRIDSGQPGALHGAWLMAGRVTDGKTQLRDNIDVPRKTMKILSGTRFQWIAYNTETKEFLGTGGGIYTTINNTYTETLEFFSRDNARVGAVLKFNYELIEGYWHHSGLSSKGDPIHEIWSKRK